MANSIISSASLVEFITNAAAKLKRGLFVNKNTGEEFESLILVDKADGKTVKCFVAFSSKLGVLSNAELKAQLHELQVVTLDSGSHILCKQGENTWQDVDLGI